MLTESFIASVQAGPKSAAASSLPKDAAIFLHDFQPRPFLKGTLKKSSTNPNCLAVTASHIFAAQSDKAIINVYSREKGNQETIAAFPFKITSLVRLGPIDGAAILALGTETGGLLLWELFTGRLVSTQPSHLQPITSLAVDSTHTFLLSGSLDSSIHVWSIPTLLSFTDPGFSDSAQSSRTAPLRHLSSHRGPITSIVLGHSHTNQDFAISASEDRTCIVWNYRTGDVLHTFLLPEVPTCLAIDPADRGFFAGLPDGSVQFINFHKAGSSIHLLYDQNQSNTPTQAAESDRWQLYTPIGRALSVATSYDGADLLTGHENGKVFSWTVGQQRTPTEIADLGQAVTNLLVIAPTGFPHERKDPAGVKLLTVVKPKPDAFPYTGGSGLSVPHTYNFTANFAEAIPVPNHMDDGYKDTLTEGFEAAIMDEYFPEDLLQAAISELTGPTVMTGENVAVEGLEVGDDSLQQEVIRLKAQLNMAESQKRKFAEKLIEANQEIEKRDDLTRMKQRAKSVRRAEQAKRTYLNLGKAKEQDLSDDTDDVMPVD